ncbi:MAG: FkbM family methyltransferase [Terriglobales bacterium]
MIRRRIKALVTRLKRYPLISRLDWQLYLLRDMWSTKVWTHTKGVVTPFGFKLTTRAHRVYALMRTGKFEPDEIRIFVKLLNITDVFVDIGANIGYYCCLALQQNKSVLAIEPQLQNLDCLYQNLTSNGWQDRTEVFPVALSSTPGLLSLYGASGPSASLVRHWAGYSSRFKQIVPVNTLDNLLSGRFLSERLIIKIDVEGAEFQVLEGALATIARLPKPIWLIEVCFREYHPSGINPDLLKIFQLFWDNSYNSYGADAKYSAVLPDDVKRWLATGVRDLQTFNYVFIDNAADLPALLNEL